ncbi:uncharacterized protein B0I36DRAFT_311162 [Microdochium trichocladiopsis]|uniref:Nicotinamide-nucleotide adenylyltransferase n=1 Tax=Microdochium trichocladiopsis TaxID=1682393 RepID=A0A9P9BWC0_9PEZI|nr:uncharacterized protein B0I36DRAFT_311162 [Microdochium trichocladiopsis]KAH7040647.1 hypothetical protein B0I36DRAFT_311162 [Microdochium trichocladiopsis]
MMMPGKQEGDAMAGSTATSKLLPFFTAALKTFQHSSKTFAVLCSVATTTTTATELAPPSPPHPSPRTLLVLDSSFNPPTVAHRRMVLSALSDVKYAHDSSRVLLLLATSNADKAPKPAAFPERLAMMYIFAEDLLAQYLSSEGASGPSPSSPSSSSGGGLSGVDIAVTTEPYFHSKSAAVHRSGFYHPTSHAAAAAAVADGSEDVPREGQQATEQVYLTGFDTLIRIFNSKYYPGQAMSDVLDPFFAHSSLRVTMRTDADWGDAAEQEAYLDELRGGKLDEMGGRTEWADKIEMTAGRKEGEDVVSSTKVRDAVKRQDWGGLEGLTSPGAARWVREQKLYEE